ncbi:hypothetical protein VULLAG_LOCUS959 [Vulpes lagopus]
MPLSQNGQRKILPAFPPSWSQAPPAGNLSQELSIGKQ